MRSAIPRLRSVSARRWLLPLTLVAAAAIAAGCGGDDSSDDTAGAEPPEGVRMADDPAARDAVDAAITIELTSSAFSDGDAIPVEFTCDGAGTSPPLTWSGISDDAGSVAVLVQDPDAPGGTFLHWSVYDIAADDTSFAEGSVPSGALEGQNGFGENAYGGPCPPEGDGAHRYMFTLYSLTESPGLSAGASPDEAVEAIEGSAIDSATLTGTYER